MKPRPFASRAAQKRARKKRTFSVSELHGSSADAQILAERERVLKKHRSRLFPSEVLTKYRTHAVRARHGWDTSHSGVMGLAAQQKLKLDVLLNDLILRHLWHEAAGVLSVLLYAFLGEEFWDVRYTSHFWAAMEVISQLSNFGGNDSRTRRIYQFLYDKHPKHPLGKQDNKWRSGAARLEFALYLMSIKQYDDAQLASAPIMEMAPYRDHAVGNLIHGLIYYHQWRELMEKEVDTSMDMEVYQPYIHASEGMGENEAFTSQYSIQMERNSNGEYSFGPDVDVLSQSMSISHAHAHEPSINTESDKSEDQPFGKDDSTSTVDHKSCSAKRKRGMVSDIRRETQWNGYDDNEDDDRMNYIKGARVVYSHRLDRTLFPFCPSGVCIGDDYAIVMRTDALKSSHTNAIKYLRKALSLDNNTTSALIPLTQLLLAGGDVEGGFKAIIDCCEGSRHSIPYRIMCTFLESLTPKHREMLVHFYEKILEIDPSYAHAIESLINIHKAGGYRTGRLLHYLSLHLDGNLGSLLVWKKLVLSFQRLKEAKSDDTLAMFLQEEVYDMWITREQWWPNKHFWIDSIQLEWKTKGTPWVIYKAAAAAHIFGSSMGYVCEVQKYLEMSRKQKHIRKLQKYIESTFDLLAYLKERSAQESTPLVDISE